MMFKKIAFTFGLVLASVTAFAHDEGHGPKIKTQGKYGGKLSSVILKKDANNHHAKAQYAAELTKSTDGTVRIYFYNKKMEPQTLDIKTITGTASYKSKNTRKSTSTKFDFKKEGANYEAKLPSDITGPVTIEVDISSKEGDFMAAFARIR